MARRPNPIAVIFGSFGLVVYLLLLSTLPFLVVWVTVAICCMITTLPTIVLRKLSTLAMPRHRTRLHAMR